MVPLYDYARKMTPTIAIIDSNSLECMAMRSILSDMFTGVDILAFSSVEEFLRDSGHFFVHFFVSADLLFRHPEEFDMLKRRIIVIGASDVASASGYKCLDPSMPETELIKNILRLYDSGHHGSHSEQGGAQESISLTKREQDVLRLIVKGHLNKEIADMLGLSVPTIAFHRNNLCRKLGTRSVGRMAIYAVLSGTMDISEI